MCFVERCIVEFAETGLEHIATAGEADLRASKYDKLYRRFGGVHAGVLAALRTRTARRGDPRILVRRDVAQFPPPDSNVSVERPACGVIPDFQWPDVGREQRVRVGSRG